MATTMTLIAKQTVGANGAASVTFSNIPQTYTDLKLVMSWRNAAQPQAQGNALLTFNGQTSRYYEFLLYSTGSAAGSVSRQNAYPYITWSGTGTAATATANTFGSQEVYIPNYTSSDPKSISSDGVSENNATEAWALITGGLWNPTTNVPITSITLTAEANTMAEFSTFYLYGISSNVTTQNTTVPYASGGDVITTDGSYWYHAFKYSGSFVPLKNLTADVLVVAGGGAGGSQYRGGGGGAGGLAYYAAQSLTASNSYSCTVGAGGAGHTGGVRNQGGNSTFLGLTAANGGGGGGDYGITTAGQSGGSGGGGGNQSSDDGAGGSATPSGQGNAGGAALAPNGGGGGGAGVAGGTAISGASGTGGNGSSAYSSWLSATTLGQNVSGTYYIAGGGSGAPYTPGGNSAGAAGYGGGGIGTGSGNGTNGTANTGGGGGGCNYPGTSGSGGSGIIIVRYAV